MATANSGFRNARLAAILVIKNRIISVGYNSKKSSPFQAAHSKHEEAIFFHAETHAIKNFLRLDEKENLKKATLYVARATIDYTTRKWVPGISKPCCGCMDAIKKYQVGRVVFYNENGKPEELKYDI